MRNMHDLFIEVTHCFAKWRTGPSTKIGSTCTPLGSVCPEVKSPPLTPTHSSMGRISLQFCMAVSRKHPLRLMVFTNIDSGAGEQIKCDLNANELSLQECQILCELRSDLVICCPVKWFLSPIVSSNDEGVQVSQGAGSKGLHLWLCSFIDCD